MRSPLEKARKNPDSNKARILTAARRLSGEYGFQGTTTRENTDRILEEIGYSEAKS